MKFIVDRDQVLCIRRRRRDGGTRETPVVAFDAQLDEVAPHVAAVLTPRERGHLAAWLAERHSLRTRPRSLMVLEALPGVLNAARAALEEEPRIDEGLNGRLDASITAFAEALERHEQVRPGDESRLQQVSAPEAMKERLSALREALE